MRASELKALVQDRSVAIIGRAGSIEGTGNGKKIDATDIVIRINWVLPILGEQVEDVGSRTDVIYHAKRARIAVKMAREFGVPTYRVKGKRRKRAAGHHMEHPNSFRPTTGYMAILDCLRFGAETISLFGFDLFRSGHIQERDPGGFNEGSPLAWQHNPDEERIALKRLIKRQKGRVIPDKILQEALK